MPTGCNSTYDELAEFQRDLSAERKARLDKALAALRDIAANGGPAWSAEQCASHAQGVLREIG